MKNNKCKFCGDDCEYWYNINEFEIYGCKNCKTSYTSNMPSEEELKHYYDGFNFCINPKSKIRIISNAYKYFYKSLNLPNNAKMLDIGGGGGFFSCAFEKFGFGKAVYIDIDNQSCEYAKSLNISKVINADVRDLKNISNEKYDFIYCRHVVEHLTDPIPIIDAAIELLNKNGLFILQYPNSLSLERLASKCFYKERMETLLKSNKDYSYIKALKTIFSYKTGNDVYPPRHLWGLTACGMKEYLSKKEGISYNFKLKSITDKIYSPYYTGVKDSPRLAMFLARSIRGGCHVVCSIRKNS